MNKTILTQTGAKVQEDLNFSENIFPYFSSSSTYGVGNIVRYEDKLYKCVVAIEVAGEWNDEDWEETSVSDLLGEVGGTKLYRHRVTWKYGDGYRVTIQENSVSFTERTGTALQKTIDVYSTIETTFTSINDIFKPTTIGISPFDDGWAGGFIGKGYYTGVQWITFNLTSSLFMIQKQPLIFVSDEVTLA